MRFYGWRNFYGKYIFRNMGGLIVNLIMFIILTWLLTNHQKVNFKKTFMKSPDTCLYV